jgi:hypothetical protein
VRQNANGGSRGCKIAFPLSSKASAHRGEGESRPRVGKRDASAIVATQSKGGARTEEGGKHEGGMTTLLMRTPTTSPSSANSSTKASLPSGSL